MENRTITELFCSYCNKSLLKISNEGKQCNYIALQLEINGRGIRVCAYCVSKVFIKTLPKVFCIKCMIDTFDKVLLRG